MTIAERVDDVQRKWFTPDPRGNFEERCKERDAFDAYLRNVLLEVARDQRHACAEAVAELDVYKHEEEIGRKAHQAVMNAEIK